MKSDGGYIPYSGISTKPDVIGGSLRLSISNLGDWSIYIYRPGPGMAWDMSDFGGTKWDGHYGETVNTDHQGYYYSDQRLSTKNKKQATPPRPVKA